MALLKTLAIITAAILLPMLPQLLITVTAWH